MADARDMSCLRVTARAAAAAIIAGCLAVARPVSAQSDQAYLSLGAGATNLSGGAEGLVIGTRFAVGAELGAGQSARGVPRGLLHEPFARQLQRKVHPFLRMSLTAVSKGPRTLAGCVGLGGGLGVLAAVATGRSTR